MCDYRYSSLGSSCFAFMTSQASEPLLPCARNMEDEIARLEQRIKVLKQALKNKEKQDRVRCQHARVTRVDSCGPRDNGEHDYICLQCGVSL